MPNPSIYFLGSSIVQKPAPAALPSFVAPTFAGIVGLIQNLDGSLSANWAPASLVPNPPVRYEVYIQANTSVGLFNTFNLQNVTQNINSRMFTDSTGNVLSIGTTYHVGIRAVDAYGNRETNTASLNQTITNANFNTLAGAVWDVIRTTKSTPGTFGEALTARVDVDVSTRSTQTSVNALDTKLGSPATTTVSGDIAAVQTKLGTPAGVSVSADIAGVKSVSDLIKIDTTSIDTKVDVTLSTRASQSSLNSLDTKIGTPSTASVVGDIATRASQTSVNAIPTNPLLTTDSRLDNLDATISSRASQSQVASIQNNTSFVGIVPAPIVLPETGTKTYPIYVRLFNEAGSPADPDSNEMYLEIKDSAGATVVASILMTRSGLGQYTYNYVVNNTDTERPLFFFFNYTENSVAFNQVRTTEVVEFESKLDTLLARLTPARATNLDNLDAAVSSRSSQTSVTAIDTKLGTPATASVSGDIATKSSQTSVTAIDTKLGTPATASVSGDIVDLKTDIGNVPTAAENADAVWDEDVNAHATGTTTARTLKDAKIFSQIDL
jgi:hypothetical protein